VKYGNLREAGDLFVTWEKIRKS